MEIIVNIGWGLAALAAGALALAIIAVAVIGPILFMLLLWDEYGQYSKWWRRWEDRASTVGTWIQAGILIALVLGASALMGLILLGHSYDTFGWPPVPEWFDHFDTDTKKER